MTALPVFLPDGFFPVVKDGDVVAVGQVLAHKSAKQDEIINIPQVLSISLAQAKKVLKKNPGDQIEAGDTIAVKKNAFGVQQKNLISKVNGIITRYERDTGNLIIRTSYHTLTEKLVSPVDGIIALCDNKKIVIQTDKNVLTGKKGSGETGEGEIFILESDSENVLYYLDSRAIDKVVVGGQFTREILVKAISLGAKGMIGTGIEDSDLEYLQQKGMQIPIIELDQEMIEKVIEWNDKRVYIEAPSKTIILLHS